MPRKIYGRTLIETMCALAVIALLLMIALPNLQNLIESNQRTQTNNQMVATLLHARSNAVFSRQIITLCGGQHDCSGAREWQSYLVVFIDKNANGKIDPDDEILHQTEITKDFSWHWNRATGYIQFEADGSTRALNGTLTLCKDNVPQSQIVISLAGRSRIEPARRGASC
ncbi:Tfp pilus assembly protein FimT [Ectopseudomonas composti]|uniref:Type II secretion system protein H n=1 Tax=Ectopseudomonas composti TaxID=658457 RepID=A0A1I5J6A6_9GAMM|nr:GspH/FimT family pseudopilin [Pseudomonas composti]SFO68414.1 Tfp pilus assembly protein FimT [Pseudomonas composti]